MIGTPASAAPGPTCTIIISTAPGTINCSSPDGDESKFFVNTTQPAGTSLVGSFNRNNGPDDMSLTANVSIEPPSEGFGDIKPTDAGAPWTTSLFTPTPVATSGFAIDGIFPDGQIISAPGAKYDGDLFAVVTSLAGTSVFEWTGLKTESDLNRVVGLDEPPGTPGVAIESVEFLLAGVIPGVGTVDSGGIFKEMKQIEVSNCLGSTGCIGGGGTPPPIPEPSTWVMMLLGFAGLGYAGLQKAKSARREKAVA
jgi:hypothetical protein